MNFLPLVLCFLLLKNANIFGNRNNGNATNPNTSTASATSDNCAHSHSQNQNGFGDILDSVEDAQQALQLVSILNKIRRNQADLTEVIGEILNNPIAINLVSKLGFGNSSDNSHPSDSFCDTKINNSGSTPTNPTASNYSTNPSNTNGMENFDDTFFQQKATTNTNSTPQSACNFSTDSTSFSPNQSSCDYQPPTQATLQSQFNGDGKTFDNRFSPADTLFKPVEKIAGVDLVDDLKKYYENWYVK